MPGRSNWLPIAIEYFFSINERKVRSYIFVGRSERLQAADEQGIFHGRKPKRLFQTVNFAGLCGRRHDEKKGNEEEG